MSLYYRAGFSGRLTGTDLKVDKIQKIVEIFPTSAE